MSQTANYKIAIIEDNKDFATVIGILLKRAAVQHFTEVSNFIDNDFALVLADLRLKETYGTETILRLKKKTSAPIIVLTGMGGTFLSASDMKMFLDAGALDAFNKDTVTDPSFPDIIEKIIVENRMRNNVNSSKNI